MNNRVLEQQLENIRKGEFPRYLYKFSPINKNLIINLSNRQLWCSESKDFNDPFDCQFNSVKCSHPDQIKVENGNKEKLSALYNDHMSKNRICCFCYIDSPKHRELLMWSHYSKSHTGVCMKFNIEKLIQFWMTQAPLVSIHKVIYDQKIPTIPAWLEDKTNRIYFATNINNKSLEWEYEQEYRAFHNNNILKIDPLSLEEVRFGCVSSFENRKTVINIMRGLGYSNTRFYKAEKSIKEFSLTYKKNGDLNDEYEKSACCTSFR